MRRRGGFKVRGRLGAERGVDLGGQGGVRGGEVGAGGCFLRVPGPVVGGRPGVLHAGGGLGARRLGGVEVRRVAVAAGDGGVEAAGGGLGGLLGGLELLHRPVLVGGLQRVDALGRHGPVALDLVTLGVEGLHQRLLAVIARHLIRLPRARQHHHRRTEPRWMRQLLPGAAFLVVGVGTLVAAPLATVRHFHPDTRWALTLIAYISKRLGRHPHPRSPPVVQRGLPGTATPNGHRIGQLLAGAVGGRIRSCAELSRWVARPSTR